MKRRPAFARRGARGFTLLETVVTLVVVSMLIALLMQALSQSLSLRTRLLRLQGEARTDTLQEAWFRESVSGAQSDLDEALGAMEGGAEHLSYVTSTPLVGHGLARVTWRIERDGNDASLRYSDAQSDLVVVRGPLSDAAFSYLDSNGVWQREWKTAAGDANRLPEMVRFEARTQRGQLYWLVPLLSESLPMESLRLDGIGNGI